MLIDLSLSPNFLRYTQGGMYSHHGREYCAYYFLELNEYTRSSFKGADEKVDSKRIFIRSLGELVTTVKEQSRHKELTGVERERSVFMNVGFTVSGYRRLDLPPIYWPTDLAWRGGTGISPYQSLGRQDRDTYSRALPAINTGGCDLLITIASNSQEEIDKRIAQIDELTKDNTVGEQKLIYAQKRDRDGEVAGPLGFTDGLSNKRGFKEMSDTLLVTERNRDLTDPYRGKIKEQIYGSYGVFLPISVDRNYFDKEVIEPLTTAPASLDKGLAEALLMGRFKDGTPLGVSIMPMSESAYLIDGEDLPFRYRNPAQQCPYFSHIRSMNPRDGADHKPQIIRRGMNMLSPDNNEVIGLCFMSFQRSISENFLPLLSRLKSMSDGEKDVLLYPMTDKKDVVQIGEQYGGMAEVDVNVEPGKLLKMGWGNYLYYPSAASIRFFPKTSDWKELL